MKQHKQALIVALFIVALAAAGVVALILWIVGQVMG